MGKQGQGTKGQVSVDEMYPSLCIFKQYIGNIKKPWYLHGVETMQVTLSTSLGFVVALSWNDYFKDKFTALSKRLSSSAEERAERLMIYAMLVTSFLFLFNIFVGGLVSYMRTNAQEKATIQHKNMRQAQDDEVQKGQKGQKEQKEQNEQQEQT